LALKGGRDVALAEQIDTLACKLGECMLSSAECTNETHPENNPEN